MTQEMFFGSGTTIAVNGKKYVQFDIRPSLKPAVITKG